MQAYSNMPVVKETSLQGVKTVEFDTSPLMSTYLLAFVVGRFAVLEDFVGSIKVGCFWSCLRRFISH